MERTSNLRPDRHQRRRNSYIIAMEADITIIELAEINRRQSIKVGSNPETKKTAHTESHESKEESEGSSPKKTHRNTIKMPSSTSISSSMQEIETLDVHFLHRHTSMNKSSASECSCQNDTSPLHRNSFSTFSIKRNDSAFSLSTCQSVLASSSARNSANTLNNLHMNRSNRDNILETNERRNSDQTYVRSYRNNQRRLSDQSFVKFNNFPGEEKSLRQSLPRPPLSLTKNSDSHSHDNWKSAKDRQRSLTRRDSETSIKSSCRGSISPITPKIMRRRFSEQLILEGGLRSEGEFEDLIEEDAGDSFTAINARKKVTLKRHYYPEGNWGFVVVVAALIVQILCHGLQLGSGVLINPITVKFHTTSDNIGWLGAMSTGVALLVSPVTIAFCRRKSTRLTAVFGGLVTALGCLFTSFASQFHQLFFSYGTVVGIGVGMTRDCSTLMVAQYFKRKREFVEIFIVSGSGLGIAVMSAFIKGAISKIGWRLGLQAVTVVVLLTFFLGTFYRSASLYHPQRRAILHLKNQKRKIKDKNKVDDRPPFFDFSTLKSKTVRILLISTGISAFGINTPIFYLAHQAEEEGLGDTVVLLQAYLGLAWTLGCVCFGLLVVHHSVECRIARQYLTQAAVFMCGLCILALTTVNGNYNAYVMFTWIYGIFCGGYHYSLKMYTYERVRARNFAKTWGFVQCSQAIPIAIGVPISGYMNIGCGGKAGYYFSSTCVIVGSFTLFFIDLHRRNLSRHKHTRSNGTKHLCVSDSCPQRRRLSFSQEPENDGVATGTTAAALVLGSDLVPGQGEMMDGLGVDKPELTCISEEGIADMDLPDNILDDLDYIGDCITSCNKVENYLMLSEFENNLIAEMPIIMDRKGRRWSLARSKGAQGSQSGNNNCHQSDDEEDPKPKWRLMPTPNNRVITVIDEASTSHIEN